MNNLISKTRVSIRTLLIAITLLIVVVVVSASGVSRADNVDTENGRLLTIHDRGTEKIILSEAATVGDALREAGITIDIKDIVEPSVSEELVASDYQINIYRARPVIIVDGNRRTKVVTPFQTASQITQSAGIILYDEDIVTLGRADDIVVDGAGLQLVIKRATPFSLTLYGNTSIVRTQAATITAMLAEKGIKLAADDRVSLDQGTIITEGLAIRVWREGKQTITVDEPVDFQIEQIDDADREVGYRLVTVAGQKGVRSVTYEIIIQDGQEVNRSEIASITTKQPSNQVEVVGVKLPPVVGPNDIIERIRYWSNIRGLDADKVIRIAQCESTFNPNAVNYRYYNNGYPTGLFQHISGYWPDRAKKYGSPGASIYDAEAQIKVTTGMMADAGYGAWECQ